MEYRKLGNSDLRLSVVGLGCWIMGRDGWVNVKDNESIAAIHTALELGINWLDTAEAYGGGHSEQLIATALEGHKREEVIIATKVSPEHLSTDELPKALDGSLKRLKTDYIDLYQIHWPSPTYRYHDSHPDVPIRETIQVLLAEQKKGKIRCIGVSNFDAAQLAEGLQAGRIESLQPPYSLYWRHIETDILPFCREHNIGVIPYSPMAQGLLTGKFSLENHPAPEDNRSHNKLFRGDTYEVAVKGIEVVREIGQKYGKTPAQTAVRWVVQQPGLTAAIVGARNPQQIKENVGAADWELSAQDIDTLSAVGDKVMATLPDDDPRPWV